MPCSIISDTIKITMDGEDAPGGTPPAVSGMAGYRSALQNPDISRVQLETLLRRRAKNIAGRARKNFWSSFMAQYRSQHANGND